MIVVANPRYKREIYHDHGNPARGGAARGPVPWRTSGPEP
jgi:hypothetical protein